jgi:hypothetical protein
MGKGASSTKSNVTKKLPDYSSEKSDQPSTRAGSGAGGGSASADSNANVCLISFNESLQFDDNAADLIKVGFSFTIVPNETDDLVMMVGGRIIGNYTGNRVALLKRCINGGYIYRGIVRSVDQNGANCEITGFGVSDGPASA